MAKTKISNSSPMGNRTTKSLDCSHCGQPVHKMDMDSVSVVCSSCVNKMCSGHLGPIKKSKKKS